MTIQLPNLDLRFLPLCRGASMKLLQADHARVEREKITDYLLSDSHPDGQVKARFFKRFGFGRNQWEVHAHALKQHAKTCPVVKTVESVYGSRYAVEGPLVAPDGRRPMVRTIWLCETGRDERRLITAYPLEELQ